MADLQEVIQVIVELIHGHIHVFTLPTKNLVGSRRSLVRMIGSKLPLRPIKRVYFETVSRKMTRKSDDWRPTFFDDESEGAIVLTLSDIGWLESVLPEQDLRQRCEHYKPKKTRRKTMYVRPFLTRQTLSPRRSTIQEGVCHALEEMPHPAAMKKISALEEELANLRAQIAAIVQNPSPRMSVSSSFIRDSASPDLISGPSSVPPPPPPCGAPPPPPPPPPVMQPKKLLSVHEIILQNKEKNGKISGNKLKGIKKDEMPDMSEVLKGLGNVKLKKIARSPGGTPIRQVPKASDTTDPAAIIARALKKKFAKVPQSSPDKENYPSRFTPSPKSRSPASRSPKFGPHLLKPVKRLSSTPKRPLMEVN